MRCWTATQVLTAGFASAPIGLCLKLQPNSETGYDAELHLSPRPSKLRLMALGR